MMRDESPHHGTPSAPGNGAKFADSIHCYSNPDLSSEKHGRERQAPIRGHHHEYGHVRARFRPETGAAGLRIPSAYPWAAPLWLGKGNQTRK